MKNIFLILFLFLISFCFYGNEKEFNIYNDQIIINIIQQNKIIQNEEMSISFSFKPEIGTELYAKTVKKKKSISNYDKHLNIGIGLLTPGVILTVLSIPLIAAGVVLTTWEETKTEVVYDHWEYATVGGPTKVTKPVEVTTYPYQSVGIPLTATGGLFFVVGVPLLIAGAVNLGFANKYKKKRAGISTNLAFNVNYNLNEESINLLLTYKF